jgi:two-component system chemotaxis response regulator CheB
MSDRITVLIVDDSRLFRAALEEALGQESDIAVIGSAFSGDKALEMIRQNRPDVVTLDVEMPGMDGLKTLQEIRKLGAAGGDVGRIGVIMVSAHTRRGAQVTIDALNNGAFDFIAKPSGGSAEANLSALKQDLATKIRAWATSRGRIRGVPGTLPSTAAPVQPRPRTALPGHTRAIVIGASTGGPRALSTLVPDLCERTELPILIVQHMPVGFTRPLAESLERLTSRRTIEADEGLLLESKTVYIAPAGRHLLLRGTSLQPLMRLTDQPPENGCRPSADVLFRSAAALLGPGALAIILTGMGRDGTTGLGAVRRAGGYVIAQDETSSVVWGMPGSAVEAGVVDQVEPLDRIAQAVEQMVNRGKVR